MGKACWGWYSLAPSVMTSRMVDGWRDLVRRGQMLRWLNMNLWDFMTSSQGFLGCRHFLFPYTMMTLCAMRLLAWRLALFGKSHVTWPVGSQRRRWVAPHRPLRPLGGLHNQPVRDGHMFGTATVGVGVSCSDVLCIKYWLCNLISFKRTFVFQAEMISET